MTYKVIVSREGGNWLADVPDVPGAHTWARSLPSLMNSVRDVIVLMDDLPDGTRPTVQVRYNVDNPDLAATLNAAVHIAEARADVLRAEAESRVEFTQAISDLKRAGLSVRDVAEVLGVTAGRVSQLVPEKA